MKKIGHTLLYASDILIAEILTAAWLFVESPTIIKSVLFILSVLLVLDVILDIRNTVSAMNMSRLCLELLCEPASRVSVSEKTRANELRKSFKKHKPRYWILKAETLDI